MALKIRIITRFLLQITMQLLFHGVYTNWLNPRKFKSLQINNLYQGYYYTPFYIWMKNLDYFHVDDLFGRLKGVAPTYPITTWLLVDACAFRAALSTGNQKKVFNDFNKAKGSFFVCLDFVWWTAKRNLL